MGDITQYIQEELANSIGGGNYQLPLYFDHPIRIGDDMHCLIEKQRILINSFYATVADIARNALSDDNTPLLNILFSDFVAGMDLNYHRNLPECCWRKPVFFRTDQSVSGKIYELQSPGSGWGDIPLLSKALSKLECDLPKKLLSYGDEYAKNIISVTGKEQPKVCHMLDAASAPLGMRYLFAQTRPKLLYWGIDRDVSMDDVHYVAAHSAASLTTSNYFNYYLRLAESGQLVFGISPNLMFDQKAIYLLPFFRLTKDQFIDEIRNIFPFTTYLEINNAGQYGFHDSNGEFVNVDEFCKRKKSLRRYFLKYGGTDLSRNWGGRGIFRLDTGAKNDCIEKLGQVRTLVEKGEIWLIQDDSSRFEASEASPDINQIVSTHKKSPHIKISAFYGSECAIGVKVMARVHYKVHGQKDTYVGIGV